MYSSRGRVDSDSPARWRGLRIFPSLIRVPSEQCSKYLFKEKKNLHTWLVDEGHLQNFIVCAKFAFDHLQKIVATKL